MSADIVTAGILVPLDPKKTQGPTYRDDFLRTIVNAASEKMFDSGELHPMLFFLSPDKLMELDAINYFVDDHTKDRLVEMIKETVSRDHKINGVILMYDMNLRDPETGNKIGDAILVRGEWRDGTAAYIFQQYRKEGITTELMKSFLVHEDENIKMQGRLTGFFNHS